jgi:hypothetical protein
MTTHRLCMWSQHNTHMVRGFSLSAQVGNRPFTTASVGRNTVRAGRTPTN